MPLEIITVLIAMFAGTAGYFFVSTVVRLNRFSKYLSRWVGLNVAWVSAA
jgi:hypothetical protein